jgi:hypothetical protein
MRETSLAAYRAARDKGILSKRRYQVVWALHKLGESTCGEVYQQLCLEMAARNFQNIPPKDSYNPRCAELADAGMLEEGPKRRCRTTGVECTTWKLSGFIPSKPVRRRPLPSIERCSTCHRPWRKAHE